MTQRTAQQNKAFRKYIRMLSAEMIDAGLDMKAVIKEGVSIDPTPEIILDTMCRPVMRILFEGKIDWKNPDRPSTSELDTKQISELYEVMNRSTGEGLGISMGFPSLEELSMSQYDIQGS